MANAPKENNKNSALAAMAERLSIEPAKLHKTLKQTVFKNASDEEMVALVVVANEHGLNPLCREIYAFPSRGGGIVPVISVDGWIRIMNSHPKFNGIHFNTHIDEKGAPISIACTIWVKGRDNPTVITEFFSECKRNTEPWQQYPHRMLRWKALAQGVRTAFGFAGYSDSDDAEPKVEKGEGEAKPVFSEKDYDNAIELFADDAPPGAKVAETETRQPETVEAS
jgi:phage recombination protein Bet|tara:strand:- start:4113 stop:4784 length:672 start_codon:yes stop_codon:yes gene_type:complete